MSNSDPVHVASEIERVINSLNTIADPDAAARGRELAQLLMSLYGAGLSRVIEILRDDGPAADNAVERLAADPLVASLLTLHDLHPHPPADRIARALSALQQALPAGLTLQLVSCAATRAHVQVTLAGPAAVAPEGLRQAIERAIGDAAPEITAIDIDGIPLHLLQILRPPSPAGVR
jgi:hypothetical protein